MESEPIRLIDEFSYGKKSFYKNLLRYPNIWKQLEIVNRRRLDGRAGPLV